MILGVKSWHRELQRTVGLYEISVGALGIVAILEYGPRVVSQLPAELRWQASIAYGVFTCAFAFLAIAGWLLLRQSRYGYALTGILQACQIPLWSVGGASYVFFGGVYFGAVWQDAQLSSIGGWSVTMRIALAGSLDRYVGINAAPIVLLLLVFVGRARFATQRVRNHGGAGSAQS